MSEAEVAVELSPRDAHASDAAIVSAAAAMLTLAVVAARQLGVVRELPDPPGSLFDTNGIVMSKKAHPLGIPDGLLGLASYGVTLGLLVGSRHARWLKPMAHAKLGMDAAAAGANTVRQVVVFRRVCAWCMATVVCTVAMVHFGRK